MLEFKVRMLASGKHAEMTIKDGGTTIETGLMDECERRTLAYRLEEAMDSLMSGLSDD